LHPVLATNHGSGLTILLFFLLFVFLLGTSGFLYVRKNKGQVLSFCDRFRLKKGRKARRASWFSEVEEEEEEGRSEVAQEEAFVSALTRAVASEKDDEND
jgi:ribosomal protein L24E